MCIYSDLIATYEVDKSNAKKAYRFAMYHFNEKTGKYFLSPYNSVKKRIKIGETNYIPKTDLKLMKSKNYDNYKWEDMGFHSFKTKEDVEDYVGDIFDWIDFEIGSGYCLMEIDVWGYVHEYETGYRSSIMKPVKVLDTFILMGITKNENITKNLNSLIKNNEK